MGVVPRTALNSTVLRMFFWRGGIFPDLLLDHVFPTRHTFNMTARGIPYRFLPFMAVLLCAVAFCGNADAALQLGIEDSAVSCVPIADSPASDREVEQSSGDYGIAVFDAGTWSQPSQCITSHPPISSVDQGTLVRCPSSKVFCICTRYPLDQVPRL